MALRTFHINDDGYMDLFKKEIKLFVETYDFGDTIWPSFHFIFAKNFKEVIQYVKARRLYIYDIWAYVPVLTRDLNECWEYKAALTPNGNAHEYLLQSLGSRFLGWDNGEQDGRFFANYARSLCPAPRSRREAYEVFSRYFYRLGTHLENYLTAVLGMYYAHYLVHKGNHRLLGAETGQALPSVPVWYAFIRGAGKQYGVLWAGNVSVWNRWGWKTYVEKDIKIWRNTFGGPTHGTSLELLKRLWYVLYMYGCCILGFESSHFPEGYADLLKDNKIPTLTPIGKLQLDCTEWCRKHPDVGVQYTPVAFLLDFYSGWAPPRTAYHTGITPPNRASYPIHGMYRVWGNMDYEKGDFQIDTFSGLK